MRLYVRNFSSTNSTFVVLDTSMLFSVMFEQFGQGEEFEMAIRTFVAPLVAATALQWRGLEAVAQFVPFHSPRFWRPKGAAGNVTKHPFTLINVRTTLFKMELNRFRASEMTEKCQSSVFRAGRGDFSDVQKFTLRMKMEGLWSCPFVHATLG